jgi:MFS family permease
MLLIVRAVGGIAYSWYVVAGLGLIYQATPATQVTTILALFNVTLPAFINITAAPLSGWVFDTVGAYWLYAFGAFGAAIAWLVMKTSVHDEFQPA